MSNGMRTEWIKGERKLTDRKGKKGGRIAEQLVVKVLVPKGN